MRCHCRHGWICMRSRRWTKCVWFVLRKLNRALYCTWSLQVMSPGLSGVMPNSLVDGALVSSNHPRPDLVPRLFHLKPPPLGIWGAWRLRFWCLSILLFLPPLAGFNLLKFIKKLGSQGAERRRSREEELQHATQWTGTPRARLTMTMTMTMTMTITMLCSSLRQVLHLWRAYSPQNPFWCATTLPGEKYGATQPNIRMLYPPARSVTNDCTRCTVNPKILQQ